MRGLGPLPVIETGRTVLIPVLPGELTRRRTRHGQVRRTPGLLRAETADAALLFDPRTERALRGGEELLLVEAEGDHVCVLGELTLSWDL